MVSAQGDAGLMNYLMMSNALGNDQLFGLLALTMGNRPAPQQTYSASNIPMGLQTSMQSSQMPTGKRGKGPQRTPTVPQSNPGYGSFGRASAGGSAGQGTSGMGGMQSMLPLLAYSGSGMSYKIILYQKQIYRLDQWSKFKKLANNNSNTS